MESLYCCKGDDDVAFGVEDAYRTGVMGQRCRTKHTPINHIRIVSGQNAGHNSALGMAEKRDKRTNSLNFSELIPILTNPLF